MNRVFYPFFQVGVCTFCSVIAATSAEAQVTPDTSVGTRVNQNGNVSEITGGNIRGTNLFHSFREFSIRTGNEAFFNNANDIVNIFSRVTGGGISNIDGLLRANGGANLFLINPAGIIFGQNARLSIGGSFFGSTADSLLFDDGTEFSASDPENTSTLTINAPIGLNFRDNPQPITNRSVADGVGLQVNTGKNITLLGGNINFEAGKLNAPAGKVNLGGLSATGTIGISNGGNLSFPDGIARSNVSLTQDAFVDVTGTRGGDISITAGNIQIEGNSKLLGGTFFDIGLPDSQSGDINLYATGTIKLDGSTIDNAVGIGNAGEIKISATNFSLINDGQIDNGTLGQGNAGNITINAKDRVSLDIGNIVSNVGDVDIQAEGNAGEIGIFANSISLTNGAQIQSGVFEGSRGNASDVTLNTRSGNVRISGSDRGTSGIFTDVEKDVVGNAGNINIDAQGSIFLNSAEIRTTNTGTGFAGDINLNASNEISIKDSQVLAEGNFGRIFIGNSIQPSQIKLQGRRTITEDNSDFSFSNRLSTTSSNADDLAGSITINARDSINVFGSEIESRTETKRTTDIDNQDGFNFSTITFKVAEENPLGRITINQSRISTTNFKTGFAGDIILNARKNIQILDTSIFSRGKLGRILIGKSEVSSETSSPQEVNINNSLLETSNASVTDPDNQDEEINAGELSLNAVNNISFVNNSEIKTVTERLGNAGSLTVRSENGSVSLNNSNVFSNVNPGGIGIAGDINITAANSIFFTNGAQLQSGIVETSDNSIQSGIGFGGNIKLNARENITLSGRNQDGKSSAIFTDVENNAIGDAGNINLTTSSLSLTDGGQLNTRSLGSGSAGRIRVNVDSLTLDQGTITASTSLGEGGNITLNIDNTLTMRNNSSISAQAFNNANGGNITINAPDGFIVAFPNQNNDILASAEKGQGGNIKIAAESVFGIQERPLNPFTNDINASSQFGLDGTISINIPDVNPIQGTNQLPKNIVEPKTLSDDVCQPSKLADAILADQESSLTIKGRGGVRPLPGDPLTSDAIHINGEVSSSSADALLIGGEIEADRKIEEVGRREQGVGSNNSSQVEEREERLLREQYPPVMTSQGPIYPARGIIFKPNGQIVLTAYPTPNVAPRIPNNFSNCGRL